MILCSHATTPAYWLGKLVKEISKFALYKDGVQLAHCSGWQACSRGRGITRSMRSLARLFAEQARHEQHASQCCMPTPTTCAYSSQLLLAADTLGPAWPPYCMQPTMPPMHGLSAREQLTKSLHCASGSYMPTNWKPWAALCLRQKPNLRCEAAPPEGAGWYGAKAALPGSLTVPLAVLLCSPGLLIIRQSHRAAPQHQHLYSGVLMCQEPSMGSWSVHARGGSHGKPLPCRSQVPGC